MCVFNSPFDSCMHLNLFLAPIVYLIMLTLIRTYVYNKINEFHDMMEQYEKERKEEKLINNLLVKLPDTTYAEVTDIERLISLEQDAYKANITIFDKNAASFFEAIVF